MLINTADGWRRLSAPIRPDPQAQFRSRGDLSELCPAPGAAPEQPGATAFIEALTRHYGVTEGRD